MSNISEMSQNGELALPDAIEVRRTDPVYMAHSYLTKIPVPAILPFIQAFTDPGDVVLDPFAGSGMTGVAAAALGRRALLFDVSVLGRHIGRNYVNVVPAEILRKEAAEAVAAARRRIGPAYKTSCSLCHRTAEIVKVVWSVLVRCPGCNSNVNFYRSLEAANWRKDQMRCPECYSAISSKATRVGEEPVLESISCACQRTQIEQPWSGQLLDLSVDGLRWPDVPIAPTRQMYVASALGKHGLTSTSAFFSPRNLSVLAALKEAIDQVDEAALSEKLIFAFTAILTRASKRYQWSRQRPLNAANANYYVAPVFYEWNVFDLFSRKVEAVIRSDDWIRDQRGAGSLFDTVDEIDVRYEIASAHDLPLPDSSVDYVFTDPPFGSNIFYADMSLFQEAWLGEVTDENSEAVVDRVDTGATYRTEQRYEELLTRALSECHRVLRRDGYLTMVFGNSRGGLWSLVQRAIDAAELEVLPEMITTLYKGQRSVKGLASGIENVTTLDLMLTMRPATTHPRRRHAPPARELEEVVRRLISSAPTLTPSHLYLELLRHGFRSGWELDQLDLEHVTSFLLGEGVQIDPKTGHLRTSSV